MCATNCSAQYLNMRIGSWRTDVELFKMFHYRKLHEIFPRCVGNFPSDHPRIISRLISLLISHSTLTEYSEFCCIPHIVNRNNRKTNVLTRELYIAVNRAAKEQHKFQWTITVSPDTRANPCRAAKGKSL